MMMSGNVLGERFYGLRTPAWHELGHVSQEPLNGRDSMEKINGFVVFDTRPVSVFLNGELRETEQICIVRSPILEDPQERVMGFASDRYQILQPETAIDLFDEKVNRPVETLGFLGKGEKMFLTWKLNSFDVRKNDQIDTYGFVALGFDSKLGAQLNVVTIRVVCQNTWMAAISQAEQSKEKGRGKIWTGRHNSKEMAKELGIWMNYVQQNAEQQAFATENLFNLFERTSIGRSEAYNLLFDVYPSLPQVPEYYPDELRPAREDLVEQSIVKSERDVDLTMRLFDGEGTGIAGNTCYDLWNSVSEMENWARATRKKPENSILFGQRANAMNRGVKVIEEYALAA